ncbi:MAG: exodeoxyribonuclease III [Patescibacteria group bacterium]|nr:exodeoxyribonuclease III [Patescibacteria group bacterium]MDD4304181.1 exodeoxyribonuclease III [Patescibacteria group bacterium]MDD4695213.1 exodeoxyribonuclease III [Patescibacteria group bacterium]
MTKNNVKKLSSRLKILSWNINGIRAMMKKGFLDFLKKQNPDILCLQEIKIDDNAKNKESFDFKNYDEFWNSAKRPGYSGTMMLIKNSLKKEVISKKIYTHDEGRVQILELKKFYLINVYFPNSKDDLARLDYKIKFNNKLLLHIKLLEKKKPVIICGDYNVAHEEIDIARPKENNGNAGFTYEERNWMTKFLEYGFVDTFRKLNPTKIQYSWWSFRAGARVRNVGWRIDYFCVSKKFMKNIKSAYILDQIQGSDHAPIGIEIK